jgi:hypothetical protein
MTKLDEALGLFPSVIKCGENWSATCQAVLDEAKAELAALRLAAQADAPGGERGTLANQSPDVDPNLFTAQPQRSQEPVAYRWRMRSAIDPSYVSYWSFGAEHPKIPEGLPCDIEPLYADTRPDRESGQ